MQRILARLINAQALLGEAALAACNQRTGNFLLFSFIVEYFTVCFYTVIANSNTSIRFYNSFNFVLWFATKRANDIFFLSFIAF